MLKNEFVHHHFCGSEQEVHSLRCKMCNLGLEARFFVHRPDSDAYVEYKKPIVTNVTFKKSYSRVS